MTTKTLPEAIPINWSDSDCITEVETCYFAGSEVIHDEDKSQYKKTFSKKLFYQKDISAYICVLPKKHTACDEKLSLISSTQKQISGKAENSSG